MKHLTRSASLLLAIAAATPLYASTLIPTKGQTPEQIQAATTTLLRPEQRAVVAYLRAPHGAEEES